MGDPEAMSPVTHAKGRGGLINMGLTCYANAIIQALRHCARIPWILTEGRYNTLFSKTAGQKRQAQQELTESLAEIFKLLARCKKGESVKPAEFWRRLGPLVHDTIYEHLAMKAPHDSHEFFLFLLDTIHEATAQEVDMRILRAAPSTSEEHLVHGALQSWQREFSKAYSPFVDLFFGLIHWRTICGGCQNASHRWESFNCLKGVVPKGGLATEAPTLESMIEADMEPETVEGYQCDKCGQRTEAKRVARLWRLPQLTVVVLKRFTPDGRKIHTRMAPLTAESIDFSPLFSSSSPERNGVLSYSLRAIVDHHGGANGGHYTAQCKDVGSGKWFLYDDEGVAELSTNSSADGRIAGPPHFGDSTYMLFFERGTKRSP